MSEKTYYELIWTVTNDDSIRIHRRRVLFRPKEKFVRRKGQYIFLEKQVLATHRIPDSVQRTKLERKIARSWHGGGMQQDDIHCVSEDIVEFTDYDQVTLTAFAQQIIDLYSVEPA